MSIAFKLVAVFAVFTEVFSVVLKVVEDKFV